ncbi:MAG: nitroreductase family protein [Actinomyces sp.]|nr:MAG: nitroreductase family protein [Actinomyces sp.]
MDVYEALYTTRAMRRVRPDPIPTEVQDRILDAAIRAPSGGNMQQWRFLLVTDRDQVARIAPHYRAAIDFLWDTIYADRLAAVDADPDAPESRQLAAIKRSVDWAAANFETYPLLFFAFDRGDTTGGSIFPAVWSAMLAARAEGVGSSLTTILAVKADEVLEILGVPADKGWRMVCCVPMGYPLGRWGVAKRRPAHEVAYRDRWGEPLGREIPEPLWSPGA